MQQPMILINRLAELSDSADTASVYERAAIYSATREIERQLIASPLCKNPAVRNLVQKACFYLCAAIEYEFLEDEPEANCLEKAEELLDNLRSTMSP